jgi:hypothetical protein
MFSEAFTPQDIGRCLQMLMPHRKNEIFLEPVITSAKFVPNVFLDFFYFLFLLFYTRFIGLFTS